MKTCAVGGCEAPAEGYGHHCNKHRARERRHGHPEQEGVTVADLRRQTKLLGEWLARRGNAEAIRDRFRANWKAVVQHAQGELLAMRGNPFRAYERGAYEDIRKVAGEVNPDEVAMTCVAMGFMWQDQPRRFRSDKAFWVQMGRRFRTLTDHHVASRWDNEAGRVKRVYRDPSAGQAEFLGRLLSTAFAPLGFKIKEIKELEYGANQNRMKAALDALEADGNDDDEGEAGAARPSEATE